MVRTFILSRSSFWLKAGLAVALAALADLFFVWHEPGSTVGLFAVAWLAALAVARPGLVRDRRALVAVLAAAVFALVLIDRPGLLAWALFGLSLGIAAMSARVRAAEPAWAWAQRLVVLGGAGLVGPLLDLLRLSRLKRRRTGRSAAALLGLLLMPVAGGAVFLALFAAANPLISDFFAGLSGPALTVDGFVRTGLWGVVAVMAWGALRPRWRRKLIALPTRGAARTSPALTTSIAWSLVVFNAVFALQNGLDIAFLWSGAPLPGDMGLADYAHRGAYPLIVTALLAGLFVLVALQPGSDTAQRPLVRRLVVVWVAQNIILVASSLLRTADYIEAYALTRFRIAAMVWMALVGVGLLLICWRMLRDRPAHWLINANVAVSLVVLAVISVVDLGAVAAAWNIRHAREVGGRGVELDLGYLRSLGAPALVSLVELEQTTDDPDLRDRTAAVRREVLAGVRRGQGEWRGWTWRDQRRLDRVEALTRGRPLTAPRPGPRHLDGRLIPPPPPPSPAVVPPPAAWPAPESLTSSAGG
ncbi:MAG: DUF4173 domain-containing protein [Alphaproteobacteria bacterium]|nr:DUF4173 domain-containing protein [Alphaproteobacteria bacterium]MBU3974974.1 DUF4173 domain-containing protein [Alphaproteobacteria bacterium]MBU4038897.1 DUF4173 domain-containing protein [Alphaproteobacteria bacterium]